MNQLQTQIKEFVLEFKHEKNEDPRRNLYLTRAAADSIRRLLADKDEKHIEIFGEDGDFQEMVEKWKIKCLRKMTLKDREGMAEGAEQLVGICEYGTRHPHLGKEGMEECRCAERFSNISWFTFQNLVTQLHPEVYYTSDITPTMQREIENSLKK